MGSLQSDEVSKGSGEWLVTSGENRKKRQARDRVSLAHSSMFLFPLDLFFMHFGLDKGIMGLVELLL